MRFAKWAKAGLRAAWHRTSVVNLIVTRRCDLACDYCRARGKGPELPVDDWEFIARRLSGRFSVFTVSGGEPLLYKGLPELINRLSGLGIAGLCTNARLLDEATLDAMHGLDYLNFSIDHTGNCASSRKTAFGKLPLMAEYARRRGFQLRGTAVITARNIHAIVPVVRELDTYGIAVNLQLVQNPGPLDAFDSTDKVARLQALQGELLEMKRAGALIDEPDDYLRGFVPFVEGEAAVECLAGAAYLAVDSDGRLMPCQDVAPVGAPLHLASTDVDAALRALPGAVADGCRCWWNCYHRNASWARSPVGFAVHSLREAQPLWMKPSTAPRG